MTKSSIPISDKSEEVNESEESCAPANISAINKLLVYLPHLSLFFAVIVLLGLVIWLVVSNSFDNKDLKKQSVKAPSEIASLKLAQTLKPVVRILQEHAQPARAEYFNLPLSKNPTQQLEINQILSSAIKRTPDALDYAYADLKGKVIYANIEEIKGLSLNFQLSAIAPNKNNSAIAVSDLITLPISRRMAVAFARPVHSFNGEAIGFSVVLFNIRQLEKLILPKSVPNLGLATLTLSANNQVIGKIPSNSKVVKIGETLKGIEEIQAVGSDQALLLEDINFGDQTDRVAYLLANSEIPLVITYALPTKGGASWRAYNYLEYIFFGFVCAILLIIYTFYRLNKRAKLVSNPSNIKNIISLPGNGQENQLTTKIFSTQQEMPNDPSEQIANTPINPNQQNQSNLPIPSNSYANIYAKLNSEASENSLPINNNLPTVENTENKINNYPNNEINDEADKQNLNSSSPSINADGLPNSANHLPSKAGVEVPTNLPFHSDNTYAVSNRETQTSSTFAPLEKSPPGKGQELAKSALNVYRQMLDTVTEAQQLSDRSNFNQRSDDNKNETMLTELPLVGFKNKQQYKPVSQFMATQALAANSEKSEQSTLSTTFKPNQFKVKINRHSVTAKPINSSAAEQIVATAKSPPQTEDIAQLIAKNLNSLAANFTKSHPLTSNDSAISAANQPSVPTVPDLILKRNSTIDAHLFNPMSSNNAHNNPDHHSLAAQEAQQEKIIEWDSRALLQGSSILLVDDNDITAQLISGMLDWLGCKVTLAQDGQDALDKLEIQIFEVVLMDIRMPRMDGLSATHAIRAMLGKVGKIPIIGLVAANNLLIEGETCLKVGMDGYISKSVDMQLLGRELSKYIKPIEDDGLRRLMEQRVFHARSAVA